MHHRTLKLRVMAMLLLATLLLTTVAAYADSYKASPNRDPASYSSSRPDKLSEDMLIATSAVAVDASTGRILFAKRADRKIYPASTTKVMTALLALEHLELDQTVTVSRNCIVGESSIYCEEGEVISVKDLLYGLMLKSGNDAAVALAEAVAGSVSDFAQMMNERAEELGCVNSNFENPHGLPNENHYTTAEDYYKVFLAAMQHEEFLEIIGTYKYTLHSRRADGSDREYTVSNTNKLLPNSGEEFAYEHMLGGKTGYTDSAQSAFVGLSEKDGMRVVTVVFGSTTEGKWTDTQKLADYAFAAYQPLPAQEIYASNAITVQVEEAQDPENASLLLNLPEEEAAKLSFLCSADEIEDLRANFAQYATITYKAGTAVTAPVQQGDTVAYLHVKYKDIPEIELRLTADRTVAAVIADTPEVQQTPPPLSTSGISIVTTDIPQGGWSPLYLLVIVPIVLFVILLVWLIVEIRRAKEYKREQERRLRTEEINRKRAQRAQSHLQSTPLPQSRRGQVPPRTGERFGDVPRPTDDRSAPRRRR